MLDEHDKNVVTALFSGHSMLVDADTPKPKHVWVFFSRTFVFEVHLFRQTGEKTWACAYRVLSVVARI